MLKTTIRSLSTKKPLVDILPSKKMMNRILFDQDSSLAYKKAMNIYQSVYKDLDDPQQIILPNYTKSDDLMTLKEVLAVIRRSTNTIDRNLVQLESELVEQAGELGNNDAISILAFKTIQDPNTNKQDYQYANTLIDQLSTINHPLTFKLAGDLAFKKKALTQAQNYWLQFIDLEPDTIAASHVYCNLGIYYYTLYPKPDLTKARMYLQKALAFGELDSTILKAHYFYSQLFTLTNPKIAKYHLEICAGKGLKEAFASLGFLEMNVFNNYDKSLEWFKLGHEADGDLSCLIGQFDCFILLNESKNAIKVLLKIEEFQQKIQRTHKKYKKVPENIQATVLASSELLEMFFRTRNHEIKMVKSSAF